MDGVRLVASVDRSGRETQVSILLILVKTVLLIPVDLYNLLEFGGLALDRSGDFLLL